jgi:hypothetical protein
MKRILYFLCLLAGVMLACNIPSTTTPTVLTPPPVAITETPVGVTPAVQANVTCNNVSLYLDPALASGFQCQTVAEVSGADYPGFAVNPQYTEITFQGYVLADRFFTPHVDVYPVQRFTEIAPDVNIPSRVSALQALIGGGTPGSDALPLLPVFNAAQEFYAHYQVLPFGTGSGIRFLTQYSQFADPVNNHEMFYSYQGLTADGVYWISAILPVSLAGLPDNGDNPPDGQTFEQFSNNFPAYIADMTSKLNGQADGDFSPTLPALDTLVASLQVTP